MKTCLRCGRVMVKNDYCKPCLRELMYKRIQEYYKEHPNEKYNAQDWIEDAIFRVEDRKRRNNEKSKKYHRTDNTLRSKIRNGLRNVSSKRFNSFNDLIGCSFNELRKHLESKFTEGMTWDNFGFGWHVDHIIPCWVFDLNDIEEQKKCFHYTNLQPMRAMDNFNKSFGVQTEFDSMSSLSYFISIHKLPSDFKIKIRTNKAGKTTYRISYKQHF